MPSKGKYTVHAVGRIVSQYKIIARLTRTTEYAANESKFVVECLLCHNTLERYPNRFSIPHRNCNPNYKGRVRLKTFDPPVEVVEVLDCERCGQKKLQLEAGICPECTQELNERRK